ncbi:MAG: hypothetical protein U0795_09885 [Pirellulales bacterium]
MPNLGAWAAAGIAAAVVGLLAAALAARCSPAPPTRFQWFVLLAILLGGLAGHAVLGMWPRWPPTGALDRLLVVILPGSIALEWLLMRWLWPARQEILWRVLAGGCWLRVLVHDSVYLQSGVLSSYLWSWPALVVGGGLWGSLQWSVVRLGRRTPVASAVPLLAASLGTAGLMIVLAGYLKGGAVALVWSAAVLGSSLGVVVDRRAASLSAVIGVVYTLLCGLALVGCWFGAVEVWASMLVIAAPLAGWLVELPSFRNWPTAVRELIRWGLVLGSLVMLLVLAKRRFDRELRPLLSRGQPVVVTGGLKGELSDGWGRA